MISIVIPVLNEEEILPELHRRLTEAAPAWNEDFEVVLVDDGSTDRTLELVQEINAEDPRFRAISLARNFGHQTAISAGIHYAVGDCVIVMDADLQDPPEELSRFLDKWRDGCDVVYGIRQKRKEGIFKRSCYAVFYRILSFLSQIEIQLDAGDFCLMDRRVVNVLKSMPESNRFVRGLRSWAGFRAEGVEYERHARAAGEVKYSFSKLLKLALDGVFSFSHVPLRMATYLGLITSALSFAGIVIFVILKLSDVHLFGRSFEDVPGWVSLVALIAFIGGIQLVMLGVLGEYIGRIFDEVKQRPLWVVKEACGFQPPLQNIPESLPPVPATPRCDRTEK